MPSTDRDKNQDEDPTWFLINMVMHTESGKLGKIDWNKFIKETDIKTKGAAVKRYECLLRSYGLNMSYQPKKETQSLGVTAGSAAGPSTVARKGKSSRHKRGDPEEDNKPDDAGDGKDTANLEDKAKVLNNYKD